MVGNEAQIFTIEGLAAGFLILFTTYLAVSTTTVLIPGDTHIADLQLTQLGNDALAIMDTPNPEGELSELQETIMNNDKASFHYALDNYLNTLPGTTKKDRIKFNASYFYRNDDAISKVLEYPFDDTDSYYHENSVTVTRWVFLPDTPYPPPPFMRDSGPPPPDPPIPKVVLLEVHLWR